MGREGRLFSDLVLNPPLAGRTLGTSVPSPLLTERTLSDLVLNLPLAGLMLESLSPSPLVMELRPACPK